MNFKVASCEEHKVLFMQVSCCCSLTESTFSGTVKPSLPNGDFGIGQEQLVLITKDHNSFALEEYGGVSFP